MVEGGLGVVDGGGGGGVDAPVEAEDAGEIVGLEEGELFGGVEGDGRGGGGGGEEDEEGDAGVGGAEDGPVGGGRSFKGAVDDIFRAVGLVALGDHAGAAGEFGGDGGGEFSEGGDGKAADEVGGGGSVDGEGAAVGEVVRGDLSARVPCCGDEQEEQDEMDDAIHLIAERFASFEGVSNTGLGFGFAAEGEEGFALEVEEVVFADESAGGDASAGEDVGNPAGDFLIVF